VMSGLPFWEEGNESFIEMLSDDESDQDEE
jgi:hypothetical protein